VTKVSRSEKELYGLLIVAGETNIDPQLHQIIVHLLPAGTLEYEKWLGVWRRLYWGSQRTRRMSDQSQKEPAADVPDEETPAAAPEPRPKRQKIDNLNPGQKQAPAPKNDEEDIKKPRVRRPPQAKSAVTSTFYHTCEKTGEKERLDHTGVVHFVTNKA
jgi:hypothetical protein